MTKNTHHQSLAVRNWGTAEWFSHLLESQGRDESSAYFALSSYHLHRHQQIYTFLERSGYPKQREALLDVGCGTGHMTELIRSGLGFRHAVGVDFISELFPTNRVSYPKIDFRQGVLPDLDFEDESFDLIVAAEVLYYLDVDQRVTAITELCRILKPGGTLLFSSALGDKYFSPESAVELVSSCLQVVETGYSHNRIYNATVGRLGTLQRLNQLISLNKAPGTEASQERLDRWRWLTNRLAFRLVLRAAHAFTNPICRLRWLPSAMNLMGAIVAPSLTKTNVNILATKN